MARAQALRGSFLMPTPSLRSSWRNLSDMTPMNGFSQGRLSRTPEGGTKVETSRPPPCAYHVHISVFRAERVPLDSCFYNNPSLCPFMHDPKIPICWVGPSRTLTSEISEKQKRTGDFQTDGLANQLIWINPKWFLSIFYEMVGKTSWMDHSRGIHLRS